MTNKFSLMLVIFSTAIACSSNDSESQSDITYDERALEEYQNKDKNLSFIKKTAELFYADEITHSDDVAERIFKARGSDTLRCLVASLEGSEAKKVAIQDRKMSFDQDKSFKLDYDKFTYG